MNSFPETGKSPIKNPLFKKEKIAGWANCPTIEAEVATPVSTAVFQQILNEKQLLLARGNGRSYGDASLNETVVSTLKFNKFLGFDPKTGLLTCQAGVLLSQIINFAMPRGWFFHVTPGHQFITIGGAIAADVHGKNHPTAGSFSRWLDSFELLTGDGSIKICSRSENADLFWKTIGGMGWTGIILKASFFLRPNSSPFLNQKTTKTASLDQLFEAFEIDKNREYRMAWIDAMHPKGRGILASADHLEFGMRNTEYGIENSKFRTPHSAFRIPFMAPEMLLNPLTINVFNQFVWFGQRAGERPVHFQKFFYPLDSILEWSRLYGRRGFRQYQFQLPENKAFDGIARALEIIRKNGQPPFLVVLKKLGDQPPEARNSFCQKGWTLALDFPNRPDLPPLFRKLDDLLLDLDGKINLAKDSASDPRLSGLAASDFEETKFDSLLRRRIFPKKMQP